MKTSGRCSEPLKGSAHATVPACSLSRSAVSVSLWTSGRFEAFAHNDETVCLIRPVFSACRSLPSRTVWGDRAASEAESDGTDQAGLLIMVCLGFAFAFVCE